MSVHGFVVMPEHVHLLVSEPETSTLADAIHFLKLSFSKQVKSLRVDDQAGVFWQKRYYDMNIRNYQQFVEKLRCIHRNPVKRGLCAAAVDWRWSSFRHYALRERGLVEIESNGQHEIAKMQDSAVVVECFSSQVNADTTA